METAFVKQLVKGEYSLYSFSKDELVYYLLQKDTTVYFLYDRVTDNLGEIKQEGNYMNYLNLISVGCEKLANMYSRVVYSDKALSDFVLKADNCSSNEKATSYYQKSKSEMHAIAFVGGFPPNLTQFTANFTLQFSLPRLYKNLSFNAGVNYSFTTKKNEVLGGANEPINYTNNYSIINIPITIQWNFTTSMIQPYFNAGLSAVMGLGIQARIGSHTYIRAEEVCNFNGQYQMILQNPAVGVAYRF